MVAMTGWRGEEEEPLSLIEQIMGPLPGGLGIINTVTKPKAK